jgi:hypothetical protein
MSAAHSGGTERIIGPVIVASCTPAAPRIRPGRVRRFSPGLPAELLELTERARGRRPGRARARSAPAGEAGTTAGSSRAVAPGENARGAERPRRGA